MIEPPRKKRPTPAELLKTAKSHGFNYLQATDCPDLMTRHARGLPKDFNPNTGRSKTHKQERCPTCGYWSLWTARNDGTQVPTEGAPSSKLGEP